MKVWGHHFALILTGWLPLVLSHYCWVFGLRQMGLGSWVIWSLLILLGWSVDHLFSFRSELTELDHCVSGLGVDSVSEAPPWWCLDHCPATWRREWEGAWLPSLEKACAGQSERDPNENPNENVHLPAPLGHGAVNNNRMWVLNTWKLLQAASFSFLLF